MRNQQTQGMTRVNLQKLLNEVQRKYEETVAARDGLLNTVGSLNIKYDRMEKPWLKKKRY